MEALWKFRHSGPLWPHSSSGGHQQRNCRDELQIQNSPGKQSDRLTKCRVWTEGLFFCKRKRERGGCVCVWEKVLHLSGDTTMGLRVSITHVKSNHIIRDDLASPCTLLLHLWRELRNWKIGDSLQNRMYQRSLYSSSSRVIHIIQLNRALTPMSTLELCVFALCFLPLLSGVFNGKFKDQFILDG